MKRILMTTVLASAMLLGGPLGSEVSAGSHNPAQYSSGDRGRSSNAPNEGRTGQRATTYGDGCGVCGSANRNDRAFRAERGPSGRFGLLQQLGERLGIIRQGRPYPQRNQGNGFSPHSRGGFNRGGGNSNYNTAN